MAQTEWRLSHISPKTDMNTADMSYNANNEPCDLDEVLFYFLVKT